MRKLLHKIGKAALSLTFLCAATAANASAVDSLVSISPDPADTLTSKTFDVAFTFSGQVTYDSVYVKSGSVENKFAVSATASETATVSVLESYWSDDVTAGLNMISVSLVGVKDSDGNYINYSSGTDGVVSTSFRILATSATTAEYKTVDPDPYWMLAQDLADENFPTPIIFEFTDVVTMSNADSTVIVEYYDSKGNRVETSVIPADSIEGASVPRTNYYGLYVYISSPTTISWDEIDYIDVSLQGVISNGSAVEITNPLVTYYTSFEDEYNLENASKNVKKAKEIEGIQTLQGIVVSKSATSQAVKSLTPGLYLMNGKKVFIK